MVNLKIKNNPKNKKGQLEAVGSSPQEDYPYGFRLSMHKNEIKKLGIDVSSVTIGQKVNLKGSGEIISVSVNMDKGGDDEYSQRLEIQITDIEIDIPKSKFSKFSKDKDTIGGIV